MKTNKFAIRFLCYGVKMKEEVMHDGDLDLSLSCHHCYIKFFLECTTVRLATYC
ncbi:hypothetical protein BDB00DRAFT_830813 [Zychaea mexicana]|uniref:uncharacterized protein n=1 Tax=Zychaea mexicana TaxID=64656 RepID=UPI0022FDFF28|nr:uncharacterized protein BDB00DRAFT_830813 [Zychaea mexicana]KAI9492022.1 hypothetical protein BDB00DRAFT_830813 [Zychaea mexicana]